MSADNFKNFQLQYAKREKLPRLLLVGKIIDYIHQCELVDDDLVPQVKIYITFFIYQILIFLKKIEKIINFAFLFIKR